MGAARRAAIIAGGYLAFSVAWIVIGGAVAQRLAADAADLERIELYKGLVFVVGTSTALFFVAALVLRRSEDEHAAAAVTREALLRAERQSLAGLFASSLAHDANNVAVVVGSALGELRELPGLSEDGSQAVQDATDALGRLTRLFKDLKAMGKGGAREPVELDLAETARRTVAMLHGHSAVKHCKVEVTQRGDVRQRAIPALVDQVLINLVINGADATGGRGTLRVDVVGEPDAVLLEVHDDGPGVPEAQRAELFKPFNSTKPHGTGLGLVSVRECARAHGGTAGYRQSPLGGAAVFVRLPRRWAPPES